MYNGDSIYPVTMEIILIAHLVLGPISMMMTVYILLSPCFGDNGIWNPPETGCQC